MANPRLSVNDGGSPSAGKNSDGSYVLGDTCNLCPDGSYVGNDKCKLAPDGDYVGGDKAKLCPDGSYVGGGKCKLCPDGTYVGGNRCKLQPAETTARRTSRIQGNLLPMVLPKEHGTLLGHITTNHSNNRQ